MTRMSLDLTAYVEANLGERQFQTSTTSKAFKMSENVSLLLKLLTADTAEALMDMMPYYKKKAVELIKEFPRLAETVLALKVVLLLRGGGGASDELDLFMLTTTTTTRLQDVHRQEMFADLQRALMEDLEEMRATLMANTVDLPRVMDGDEDLLLLMQLEPSEADELLASRAAELAKDLSGHQAALKAFVRAGGHDGR